MHILWLELGSALLIAVIAIPLILRKVPKNMFYGMRTPKTMNGSDENWYELNHLAGMAMMWSALIAATLMLLVGLLAIAELARIIVSMCLLLSAVLAPLVLYRKRLF
jgi:uncharacterized membrane protein